MTLTKWDIGQRREFHGHDKEVGICLRAFDEADDEDDCRVLFIHKEGSNVVFSEMCDSYYRITMSKEDAITALKEAIAYIESEHSEAA